MEQNEKLWRQLECPVCYELVSSPIQICQNGHHVCKNCRERCAYCPQCRTDFLNARVQILDSLYNYVPLPCPNRDHGCRETFKIADRQNHKAFCPYNPFKCPLDDCEEVVGKISVTDHLQARHPSIRIIELLSHQAVAQCSGTISDMHESILSIRKIPDWGLFFYQRKRDASNFLIVCIQYFGTKEEASMYEYDLVLTQDRGQKFTFSGPVESIALTYEELRNSGNYLVVGVNQNGENPDVTYSLTITIRKTNWTEEIVRLGQKFPFGFKPVEIASLKQLHDAVDNTNNQAVNQATMAPLSIAWGHLLQLSTVELRWTYEEEGAQEAVQHAAVELSRRKVRRVCKWSLCTSGSSSMSHSQRSEKW